MDIPEYYAKLGDCLAALMVSEKLSASSLSTLTNKMIYCDLSSFPVPKIVAAAVDYEPVWKRLHSQVVGPEVRDILFLLIHNKLPVPERLFRIGLKQDPYCQYCEGAEVPDLEHFFCSCVRIRQSWSSMRMRILGLCDQGLMSSNWELVNLFLPSTQSEQEIVWLIGNFVWYVHQEFRSPA